MMKMKKICCVVLLAAAVTAVAAPLTLRSTPYASELTNNNGTIQFYLNESNAVVQVTYTDDGTTNASFDGITTGTNFLKRVNASAWLAIPATRFLSPRTSGVWRACWPPSQVNTSGRARIRGPWSQAEVVDIGQIPAFLCRLRDQLPPGFAPCQYPSTNSISKKYRFCQLTVEDQLTFYEAMHDVSSNP